MQCTHREGSRRPETAVHAIALSVSQRTEPTPKLRLNGIVNKQAAAPQGRPDDIPQNTCRLERETCRYNKEGEKVWGERWEKGGRHGREMGKRKEVWGIETGESREVWERVM